MSDNSEMVDAKETSLAAVTDDSCTLKYIEIVPLDRPADDYCKPEFIEQPVVEVKPEDQQSLNQEHADENDSEATYHSVIVRFQYTVMFFIVEIYILHISSSQFMSYLCQQLLNIRLLLSVPRQLFKMVVSYFCKMSTTFVTHHQLNLEIKSQA